MNATTAPDSRLTPSLRRLRLAAALLVMLAGVALHASEAVIVGEPRTPTDAATIRALEDEGRLAVLHEDYATLERLWSDQFVVNSPGNFVLPNRAAVFDLFRKYEAGMYSSFEKNIECIAFNGDLAIVMGLEVVTPKSGVTPGQTSRRRYTNIWRFGDGTWLLIARQATLLPPGAPSTPPPASR